MNNCHAPRVLNVAVSHIDCHVAAAVRGLVEQLNVGTHRVGDVTTVLFERNNLYVPEKYT